MRKNIRFVFFLLWKGIIIMKYKHAITLDKPLLSLEEIIKIFQMNEVTQPIRKRDSSIYRDTEDYIAVELLTT